MDGTGKNGILIFSRLDSRRLPEKALIDIAARPLLGRVIDRAKRVASADAIIVATSDRAVDDPIAAFAEGEGVSVFRGATDDVAGRALAAAQAFGLDRFVRICGDRPFFDPALADKLLARHAERNLDVMTTMMPRTYPVGLTTEIVATEALARTLDKTNDPEDREHLTRYFYAHADDFRMENEPAPAEDISDLRLVVDDETDLARARFIAERLDGDGADADTKTIAHLARTFDTEFTQEKGIPA